MISKLSNRVQIINTKSRLSKMLDLSQFTVHQRLQIFEFYSKHDSFEIIFKNRS